MPVRSNAVLSGLTKWPMEHYTVHVAGRAPAKETTLKTPLLSYYADPFLWMHHGQLWAFVEEFRYLHDRGRIVAVPLDGAPAGARTRVALDLPYHLSFPFLFEDKGDLFMLPESRRNHTLTLFVCEDFPDRWRPVRNIFSGVDVVDSVIFQREGLWWIITSLRHPDKSDRSLAIFYTEDFRGGEWIAHPVNGENLFSDRAQGFGRNGGSVVEDGQNLFRIMQASRDHYGQSVEVMRILELTPRTYREAAAEPDTLPLLLRGKGGAHHVSLCGTHVAWDVRDRVSYRQHLPGARTDRRRS